MDINQKKLAIIQQIIQINDLKTLEAIAHMVKLSAPKNKALDNDLLDQLNTRSNVPTDEDTQDLQQSIDDIFG